MEPTNFGDVTANPSGAPEAGGATNAHSMFGGESFTASFLRMLARVCRYFEASAYRGLRDLERRRTGGKPSDEPGAPRRTREAGPHPV